MPLYCALPRGSRRKALQLKSGPSTPSRCITETGRASDGIPKSVTELKKELADSDGLLLATPEYNNSIPGVLKNAIDWLSRPPADIPRVFARRPVAIMGATPGGFGTVLSQSAWLPVLRTLGMQPWFGGRLYVSGAGKLFDDSGKLIDHDTSERLQNYISDFVKFITG